MVALVGTRQEYVVEEGDVCLGVEIFALVSVCEFAGRGLDAREKFLRVALAQSRHLRL